MRWRSESPALRLFTQPFIQAQIKENIKAPRHRPLWGEFTDDRRIPAQMARNAENVSMTSSWHVWKWRRYTSKQITGYFWINSWCGRCFTWSNIAIIRLYYQWIMNSYCNSWAERIFASLLFSKYKHISQSRAHFNHTCKERTHVLHSYALCKGLVYTVNSLTT